MNADYAKLQRFSGLDFQWRRSLSNGWERPWRGRIITRKNERDDYRLIAWGDSMEEVIASLSTMLDGDHLLHTKPLH